MKVFKLYLEFHSYLNKIRENKTVAFVPTMGSLHQAHLDLVEEASKAHDIVVCSIFVNPRQFNNVDDYTSYPRDIDKDIRKLQNTSCTILYSPKESELYNSEEIELFYFDIIVSTLLFFSFIFCTRMPSKRSSWRKFS